MKPLKVTIEDCTFKKPKKKKHKVIKKRLTVHYCNREGCTWYKVPSLSNIECVMLGIDNLPI